MSERGRSVLSLYHAFVFVRCRGEMRGLKLIHPELAADVATQQNVSLLEKAGMVEQTIGLF